MNPNQPLISSNRPVVSPHSPVPVAPMVVTAPETQESTSCCHFSNNFYLTAAFGFTLSVICVFQVGFQSAIIFFYFKQLGLKQNGRSLKQRSVDLRRPKLILNSTYLILFVYFVIQTVFLFVLGYILPTCFCSDFWRHLNVLSPNAKLIYSVLVIFLSIFTILGFICLRQVFIYNRSQLKNPDISGAHYTLRIQYNYTRTQCEDGARDDRVL